MDYSGLLSERAKDIKPSGIRKYFDVASSMEDCISLGVGEPDFKTPWSIRQAGIESLEKGRTWYTSNHGLMELRKEICDYMHSRFGLSYNPDDETLVTVGGSEGIDIFLRAVINPGDEVIIPEPCYVSYTPITELCGGVCVPLPLKAENSFRLTPAELRAAITPKTKALIMPFPCNPTGAVMHKEDLLAVAEVLRETNILVLSDEIYSELTYTGERHYSIAEMPGMRERTVVINGFSKSFAMTGWRLGFACGPKPIMDIMNKIHQFAIMCAPSTSQFAAINALKYCGDEVKKMHDEYDMRRRLLVSKLNEIGLSCFSPEGAFYVFPSIQKTGLTSDEFCDRLLREKRVAVVAGTAFGSSGEGFVRISYSYSIAHLTEGLRRISEFVKELENK